MKRDRAFRQHAEQLVNAGRVFALIGAVGTPTSHSAVPIAVAAGVPFLAPFTGTDMLRDPELGNVVNLRASYNQETEEMGGPVSPMTLGLRESRSLYQKRFLR